MTDNKSTKPIIAPDAPKRSLRDRITPSPATKAKTRKVATYVVGGTAVAAVVVYVAKKRGVTAVEVTLPDVEVTTEAS